MKFKIRLSLCATLIAFGFHGWSQGFVENALFFSRTKPGGSSRVQSMGGAQVALGGDYSSALSNPAGLGMYNRSEITFTPAFNTYKTDSKHLETKSTDSKKVFNIPGISYVRHMPTEKNGFLGGSFGATLTRINDFNTSFQYTGKEVGSSIIDYFKERAFGYAINPLPNPYDDTPLLSFDVPEGLAYSTFLINPFSEADPYPNPFTENDYLAYTRYFSDLDASANEVRDFDRYQHVNTKGAQYQWSFAYGGNYLDKLFFGGAVGITTLRYKFESTYRESEFSFSNTPNYDSLNYFQLHEDITIDGSGINLTLGLIYRPVNFVQVGISFVTPTYYEISDVYSTHLIADWRNDVYGGYQEEFSEPIVAEYTLTTPLKFSTGVAFFLGKHGFITGDFEFINYNKATYDSSTPGVSFNAENQDIKYYYTNVMNYRLGVELRYTIFRLRGGYNLQSNPYKEAFNIDRKISTWSTGVGVKLNTLFVDIAWQGSNGNSTYSPYVFQDGTGPVASLRNKTTSGMFTIGYTF